MVYMLIKGAVVSILSVQAVFEPFKPRESTAYDLRLQKAAFVACQSMLLALGLWKVNGMGLLPTRLSDWIMYEARPVCRISFLAFSAFFECVFS